MKLLSSLRPQLTLMLFVALGFSPVAKAICFTDASGFVHEGVFLETFDGNPPTALIHVNLVNGAYYSENVTVQFGDLFNCTNPDQYIGYFPYGHHDWYAGYTFVMPVGITLSWGSREEFLNRGWGHREWQVRSEYRGYTGPAQQRHQFGQQRGPQRDIHQQGPQRIQRQGPQRQQGPQHEERQPQREEEHRQGGGPRR